MTIDPNTLDWIEPWRPATQEERPRFTDRIQAAISPGHPLEQRTFSVIGCCLDGYESIMLSLDDGFASVILVEGGLIGPKPGDILPRTHFYSDWPEFLRAIDCDPNGEGARLAQRRRRRKARR